MFFATQLASAGIGAAGSLTICYPLDFARTRLASDVGSGKKTFNGIGDCIKKTVKASGFFGLYNGFGASVGGVMGYRGMQLGCFDTINSMNPYQRDLGIMGIACGFAAGMASLTAAMPLSYPMDTIRRRLQMESEKPMDQRIYKTTGNCVKVIVQQEGFTALYKGLAANMVRGAGAAMVPVLYEKGKIAFGL